MKRKICVVTGTRAEYGLLYWLMKEILGDSLLELQLVVTGMHLSPEFGMTYELIERDGFRIDEKVEMLLSSDSSVGITKSIGIGLVGFADVFERLKPDVVVVLGDRYEIFAAAQAAFIGNYPIAHIHGGESTEGVLDEGIRHSITKLSHLHFVAAEPYRRRVIQLGEDPSRVFNFGAPGIDNIQKLPLMNKEQIENELKFNLGNQSFLITYHPETLDPNDSIKGFQSLLSALEQFPKAHMIFTHPNSDANGRAIRNLILDYQKRHTERIRVFTSMGQLRYLSALRNVDVVIGNSSSGIIEAPVVKTATVNIGDRQTGRLKAASILDCMNDTASIVQTIQRALSAEFKAVVENSISLYGEGNASNQIKECLKTLKLDNLIRKRFYDIG